MTKAPERIWAFYTPDDFDDSATITAYETTQYGGQEHLHTDHALALVAAALEPWVKLRDESRGVTGFHLNGNEADWDEFDLPELDDDAQAALERRDARIRNETLDAASEYLKTVYGNSPLSHPVDRNRILAMMEDQSDD